MPHPPGRILVILRLLLKQRSDLRTCLPTSALRGTSLNRTDCPDWDGFARRHKQSCVYHLAGLGNAISNAYGHDVYFLAASTPRHAGGGNLGSEVQVHRGRDAAFRDDTRTVVGILPLVHVKHFLFGNSLVSMPYFDSGGVLAETELAAEKLLANACELASDLRATRIELRQSHPFSDCDGEDHVNQLDSRNQLEQGCGATWGLSLHSNRHRMILQLPESPGSLMESFKPKLRSQIRKPMKEGLTARVGGCELLGDFYTVFAANMRDLGSPVHSKKFIAEVVKQFPDAAKLFVVYAGPQPVAGSVAIGFKETLSNPWASSLRAYSKRAPNMLLYLTMLEYASQHGYKWFDFGRSTPGEGTYKFKEQWGAKPIPLYWYCLARDGDETTRTPLDKRKMTTAIQCWRKLPLAVTKMIGPQIRRYISL